MSDIVKQIEALRNTWAAEAQKSGESAILHNGAVKAATEILKLMTTSVKQDESPKPKRQKKTEAVTTAVPPGRGPTV